jgi:cytochrome c oxidase cbb3-type subunit 1|tara:strand:+ start:3553 stop:5052 length:1500 start_codon:yes stop_codon:yes gene_type:complete
MSASSSLLESFRSTDNPALSIRAKLSEVDDSMRLPAIFFIVASVAWLLVGTVFALLTALSMHPAMDSIKLGGSAAETMPILRTVHLNAMAYGWGNNIAFAIAPWIMGRLCKTRIRHIPILLTAGVFYNIGVLIGIIGILAGHMHGPEWLEMPAYATPLIAISFAMVGVWVIIAFRWRQSDHIYVSQWYILAAFFWLPWLYTTAQIMLILVPVRGVVQSLTNWWFAHNVLGLWLTPIALATIYYLIPKVLGRAIHSYYLSVVGFWALAFFYNWAGVHHLIGGPVPAWVVSAGTVASVMMVIPVLVTAINHHLTVVGLHKQGWASPTMRFIIFGAINYTVTSMIGSTMALRSVNEVTHFTHFTVGHAHHGVYAFYTMVMFGAVYYMFPRILHKEWPSAFLIRTHWWMCSVGIVVMVIVLSFGGWIQGTMMNALTDDGGVLVPTYTFEEVSNATRPYLIARSFSGVLITIGHIAFAISVCWILFKRTTSEIEQPTLLTKDVS